MPMKLLKYSIRPPAMALWDLHEARAATSDESVDEYFKAATEFAAKKRAAANRRTAAAAADQTRLRPTRRALPRSRRRVRPRLALRRTAIPT